MRKWMRFNVAAWCVTIGAVFWLTAVPPLKDFWAAAHWNKIPCHAAPDAVSPDRYFYEINGWQYDSERRDFWQSKGILHAVKKEMTLDAPDVCWANPNSPEDTVRALDAHSNFSHAGGHLAAAVMLVIAVLILTRLGSRKKN